MGFLRYDGEVMGIISRIVDYVWLSILCFVCSIPIFTAGAAVSAKYYTAMKLERGEAPVVTIAFFRSFKRNLGQNVIVTMILFLIYAFFIFDWYLVLRGGTGSMNPIMVGMLGMFSAMVLVITFCIFPLLARFEMKTFESFRNALVFGVVHLPRVVLGIFMAVIPYIIGIWYYKWAWLIWLFIQCVALYYNARFFVKKFDILEERAFGPKEEIEELPELKFDDLDEAEEEKIEEESSDEEEKIEEESSDEEDETEEV